MITYPSSEDYLRAVQNPSLVFRTPSLQQAQFAVHPILGIPMPASGNAAVVFRAKVSGTDYAFRFFLRADVSERARYEILEQHIDAHRLNDCTAHPEWIDDAILVGGRPWPMIKMEWVEGRTLDAYVAHLVATRNSSALRHLAGEVRRLVERLQGAGFAHGDLQHGNVLVDSRSKLRLVDFDGSWVSGLSSSSPPQESGHPNYQLVGRRWGTWMDTFPGLVIYTSLLAVAERPELWTRLHTGDNLLFTEGDFHPQSSRPVWTLLRENSQPELATCVDLLKSCCQPRWNAAQPLEQMLGPISAAPALAPGAAPAVGAAPAFGVNHSLPWWVQTGAAPTGPPVPSPRHLPPPPPKQPGHQRADAAAFQGASQGRQWYPPPSPAPAPYPPVTRAPSPTAPPRRQPAPAQDNQTRTLVIVIVIIVIVVTFLSLVGANGG